MNVSHPSTVLAMKEKKPTTAEYALFMEYIVWAGGVTREREGQFAVGKCPSGLLLQGGAESDSLDMTS